MCEYDGLCSIPVAQLPNRVVCECTLADFHLSTVVQIPNQILRTTLCVRRFLRILKSDTEQGMICGTISNAKKIPDLPWHSL